jgi:hypothetical protein
MTAFVLGALSASLVAGVLTAWRSSKREQETYDLGRLHGTDDGLVKGYRLGWEARSGAPLDRDEIDRLDAALDAHIDAHTKENRK